MNFWLCCVTQDNLNVALEAGVIGFKEHVGKNLARAGIGDKLIFYVSREQFSSNIPVRKCFGIAVIKESLYISSKRLWPNGLFPYRINIEVLSRNSARVETLIPNLSFIKNKKNWGSAFFPSVRQISPIDFELISRSMG